MKAGHVLGGQQFHVHLDGLNQLDYLTGEVEVSPRPHFFYVSGDCDLTALRWDNWKFVFLEQRAVGTIKVWMEPYTAALPSARPSPNCKQD